MGTCSIPKVKVVSTRPDWSERLPLRLLLVGKQQLQRRIFCPVFFSLPPFCLEFISFRPQDGPASLFPSFQLVKCTEMASHLARHLRAAARGGQLVSRLELSSARAASTSTPLESPGRRDKVGRGGYNECTVRGVNVLRDPMLNKVCHFKYIVLIILSSMPIISSLIFFSISLSVSQSGFMELESLLVSLHLFDPYSSLLLHVLAKTLALPCLGHFLRFLLDI